jgi:hypothetical protein
MNIGEEQRLRSRVTRLDQRADRRNDGPAQSTITRARLQSFFSICKRSPNLDYARCRTMRTTKIRMTAPMKPAIK